MLDDILLGRIVHACHKRRKRLEDGGTPIAWVLTTLLLVRGVPTPAGDLSPATWSIEQRTAAEKLEAAAPAPPIARVLESRTGMVAATLSPIAALAGVEALNTMARRPMRWLQRHSLRS